MICPKCKAQLAPGMLFCGICGARVNPGAAASDPAGAAPVKGPESVTRYMSENDAMAAAAAAQNQRPAAPKPRPVTPAAPRQPQERVFIDSEPPKDSSGGASKKAKVLLAIIIPAVCVLIAILVLIFAVFLPNGKYNDAMALKDAGRYSEAIAAFEALGYTNSDSVIRDCRYESAQELYNTGRYDEAISQFEMLGGYKDSELLLKDCRYFAALDLYNSGDYEGALAAFRALNGYKNSDEQATLCDQTIRYDEAMRLYNAGAYEDAQAAFEALGDYGDSAEMARKCAATEWQNVSVGDYIVFGAYEQDNNSADGKEEIEWLVLDKRSDSMLVVSRYALDCFVFYPSMANITWDSSSIRNWLNSSFLNSAFSAAEQSLIRTTTVSADKNPRYNTYAGSSTSDKVFLLSISEVGWYFSSDADMQCKGTAWCYAEGAYIGTNNNCWWWLRTPGDRMASAATVSSKGGINYSGNDVDAIAGGIRPAMWITIG